MATFEEAVNRIKHEGKRAYRPCHIFKEINHWNNKEEISIAYLYVFDNNTFKLQREDCQFKLMTEDFEATDWVVEE